MVGKRKIAIFTSSRAEYGLLHPIISYLYKSTSIKLQIYVSGTHLDSDFGYTLDEIEEDFHEISAKIKINLSDDSSTGIARAMSDCLVGTAETIKSLKPDLFVVLGDRFETFMACQASMINNIPIAHIHGGELTEGALDDVFRHSITKMSHFHFVAAEEFKQRVMQLGENPKNIFVSGATGIDNIASLNFIKKIELEKTLDASLKAPLILMTYHPVTLDKDATFHELKNTLTVLEKMNATLIVTGVNADPGRDKVNNLYINFFKKKKIIKAYFYNNLGFKNYLSLMSYADLVIGNSSSGIIEAPAIGVPSIDIGQRQKGRPKAPSVLWSDGSQEDLLNKIGVSFSSKHIKLSSLKKTPYGKEGASRFIADKLVNLSLSNLRKKEFFDMTINQ